MSISCACSETGCKQEKLIILNLRIKTVIVWGDERNISETVRYILGLQPIIIPVNIFRP